jgi:hypothetical protein
MGPFDRVAYREGNWVKRLINRLKRFRRVATRYEKLATNTSPCSLSLLPYFGSDCDSNRRLSLLLHYAIRHAELGRPRCRRYI